MTVADGSQAASCSAVSFQSLPWGEVNPGSQCSKRGLAPQESLEGLNNALDLRDELGDGPQFRTERRAEFLGSEKVVLGAAADDRPLLTIQFSLVNCDNSWQDLRLFQHGVPVGTSWRERRLYSPLMTSVKWGLVQGQCCHPVVQAARLVRNG